PARATGPGVHVLRAGPLRVGGRLLPGHRRRRPGRGVRPGTEGEAGDEIAERGDALLPQEGLRRGDRLLPGSRGRVPRYAGSASCAGADGRNVRSVGLRRGCGGDTRAFVEGVSTEPRGTGHAELTRSCVPGGWEFSEGRSIPSTTPI